MHMLRLLICAALLTIQVISAVEFGVGFSLSLDHGVASVYFSNGSFVNLVEIAGGSTYKQAMRSALLMMMYDPSTSNAGAGAIENIHDYSRFSDQSLRDYLPPWLGGTKPEPHDEATKALERMLQVIKLATETYLDTEIHEARIALPFRVSNSFDERVRAAASAAKLDAVFSLATGDAAWAHHEAFDECSTYDPLAPYPEDALFLGVDFSKAALTTTLTVMFDCGIFEILRILHTTDLGAERLFELGDWHGELRDALRNVTGGLPINDGGPADGMDHVQEIILLGDSVKDVRFQEVLKEVLGEQFTKTRPVTQTDESETYDPRFIAAIGAAYLQWHHD